MLLLRSFFSPASAWRRHTPLGCGPLCPAMSATTSSYDGEVAPEARRRPFPKIHGSWGTRMIFAEVPELPWITQGARRLGACCGRRDAAAATTAGKRPAHGGPARSATPDRTAKRSPLPAASVVRLGDAMRPGRPAGTRVALGATRPGRFATISGRPGASPASRARSERSPAAARPL